MSKFTHLHLHTVYSVLDGASKIDNLIDRALEQGMDSIAITDHGNMFGVLDFYNVAKTKGIKPIIGVEAYVARQSMSNKKGKLDRSGFHLILLAKNLIGYKNLIKMVSEANLRGYYYTPRIDKELLSKYSEGLIVSSACLGGELAWTILNKGEEEALKVIEWYRDLFADDYYLEMMDHGLAEQKQVNESLIRLSKQTGVKLIATNDVHYIRKEDYDAHKILIKINTGNDDETDLFYSGNEYLKSYEEMATLFSEVPEALSNTQEIVDKIEDFSILHDVVLPVFEIPKEFEDDNAYLKHLSYEGAKKRYPELTDEIKERIDFELSVIKKMDFPGYFLIVQDFIAKAREMNVLVGPGRGSAAGSIIAFCLWITNIDPIKYNLLFERFLNPDRISMPDIDIDFDDDGRDKVIDYVVNKYGADKVAQIITMGKLAARSSIRDVARVFEKDLSFADKIAKLIPEIPGITIEGALKKNKELKDFSKADPEVKKILDLAIVLEGNIRNTGVHACGVIIGREALDHFVPLARQKEKDKDSNLPLVQFEGSVVEQAGLLKMDFLGLKTLSIIKDCIELVKKRHNQIINIDEISLEDEKTFELYQNGETIATFQFESEGMRSWLKKLKPTKIDDLIAMNALYRPGPMDYIPNYVNRKIGKEKIDYPHPLTEEVLKETNGIMIYQEQIMLLSQQVAGFTKGKADKLRKAMGKKIIPMIEKLRPEFVEGAIKNGLEKKQAEDIYSTMAKFGEYGFNKSHSAAYSVLAYQTAYLKANYPAEYMSAVLGNNINDLTKITTFINECNRMGVLVLGPDINESELKFAVNAKNEIRFGFAALKNVGEAAADAISKERQENGSYQDVHDFFNRISLRIVNKRAMESLASTGAFASLDTHRAQFFYKKHEDDNIFLEKLIKHAAMVQEKQSSMQASLFEESDDALITTIDLPDCERWKLDDLLKMELEIAGFYISGHPLDEFKATVHLLSTHTIIELDDDLEALMGKNILFSGVVKKRIEKYDKKGHKYLTYKLFDFSGEKDFMLFRNDFERFASIIQNDSKLFIHARVEEIPFGKNKGLPELKIQKIYLLNSLFDNYVSGLAINLSIDDISTAFTDKVQDIINMNGGQIPLMFTVSENGEDKKLSFGSEYLKLNVEGFYKLYQLDEIRQYSVRNSILKSFTKYTIND